MAKNKKIIITVASVLCAAALIMGGVYGFLLLNDFHVTVTPAGEQSMTLEYGQSYEEQGASAHLFGKWIHKNGKPLEVITEGSVDSAKLGSYTVKYSAKDGSRVGEAVRTVTVVDTAMPVITLSGSSEMSVTRGKAFEDPGAAAEDNYDGNITAKIAVTGDAGETTSTSQVAKNVINGMASHSVSVVLQHDIKSFSVNAVEQIIQWGLENGYTFKACDMSSPTTHHGINN